MLGILMSAALAVVSSWPAPSSGAFGDVHDDTIIAGVYIDDSAAVTGCTWSIVFPRDAHSDGDAEVVRRIGSRTYVLYECNCNGNVTLHWIPELSADELAEHAAHSLSRRVPSPVVGMAPPPDAGVVNSRSWFWVSPGWWTPVSVTATIPTPRGPLGVTTTATPTTLRFAPGDGASTVSCRGPGVMYTALLHEVLPTDCTHRWSLPSIVAGGRFASRISIVWEVRWRATTGASGTLPDITTSLPIGVAVDEVHALARRTRP
ncbi:MAG: hypothetical protein ACO3IV_02850 [Ilumatobacteraceae bacterium]